MTIESGCPACGARELRPFYAALTKCDACSHVWADLKVDWEALQGIYKQSYFLGEEYSNYKEDRRILEKNFSRRLGRLRQYLTPSHRRLFEIGCAYGFFLALAQTSFESVEGIDISEDAVAFAVGELGVRAACADLLAFDLADRQFDVVCMWDTIEHLAAPREYLECIAGRMPRGALIALTTGDISSVTARIQRERWRLIHPLSHLQYFTRVSLTALLGRSGFKVRAVEYCGFSRSLRSMVHNLVALRWRRPGLAGRLSASVPRRLDVYLNLRDILYVIAERR